MMHKDIRVRASVWRLAWPTIVENMSGTLVSFVDNAMVGSLGALATAAVGVNSPMLWLLGGMVSALGVGGTALVARAIGAGDRAFAQRVCRQAALCGVLLGALLCALTLACADLVPVVMRADMDIRKDAAVYMRMYALCFVPHYTGMVLSAMLRGAGDTKTPMTAALMANILNVALNFIMIYQPRVMTVFGAEVYVYGMGLGVRGAALASAIALSCAGVFVLLRVTGKKSALRLTLAREKHPFDKDIIRRVARVGMPAALERAAINVGQIVFAGMVAAIGTVELAAHHLSITIEALGYMPGNGFAAAATALVGQYLGAGMYEKARALGKRAIGMCIAVMSMMGVLMFIFADALIAFFTPDEAVRAVGAMLIRICAFEQPVSALSIAVPGALRGAGDTLRPFLYSLFSMWCVRIVLAYVLGTALGMGVAGIWWAMVIELCVRGVLLYVRFARGKWRNIRV